VAELRFFQPGDRVTFRPDRADAYGRPRGETYTVVRTYPHKRHKRTWVVLSGLPNNEDGSPPTVDSRELRYAPSTRTLRNTSVPDEGPIEHLKNAAAIIQANLELGDKDALVADDAKAVLARIKTALQQLEQHGHVYMGLPRKGNRRSVRRGNPALAVLGNPHVADATLATWAKIEYMRPDDPDGSDVVRVHEFSDGFEIAWLDDGSVQLSHPRHPLWTDDKA
jgi:hypothetical protein